MRDRIALVVIFFVIIMLTMGLTNLLTHRAVDDWWKAHHRNLRIHADYLGNLIVRDGSQGITAAQCPEGKICFDLSPCSSLLQGSTQQPCSARTVEVTGMSVWYAPFPRLTVKRWMNSPFGGPPEASETQWSCPPPYTLKFDEIIPYCESEGAK